MKRKILILAIFSLTTALGYAGPEPLPSGKEMKEIAPTPPPCSSWTGFYFGALGGYKFGATDTDLDLFDAWNADPLDRADRDSILSESPSNLNTSGGEVGGLVGYNYQWNKWVFGLEASGAYLWLDDSDNSGFFTVPATGDVYTVRTSFETHYLVAVGPRIGYAFCNWMPYVTGGLAIGEVDFHQHITQFFGGVPFFDEGGSTDETRAGWMVGGGLEYAFNVHWRVRAQYQFVDLGESDFFHSTPGTTFLGTPGDYSGHSRLELREHNASFALMYKF